jgi:hypothetical protein
MANSKIARQAYRRTRQADLASFADNVFNRTNGVPTYATIQASITALAPSLTHYKETLAASRNRGIAEVLAKNLAREELLRQLDIVANAAETLAGGNPQIIVEAGFTIQQSSGQRYTGELPPPVILRAFSTGKKGEIRISLDDIVPTAVRTHAIEYSLDKGSNWQNGEYNSRRNFIAKGLPHSPELWIHLKSVGHGDKKSQWSEPTVVAVL